VEVISLIKALASANEYAASLLIFSSAAFLFFDTVAIALLI